MEIDRLVRRTAVGGLIVAGGVVAAQSAASAEEASATEAAPVKRKLIEDAAPAAKTAPSAAAKAKAAATTKKATTNKRRVAASTVKAGAPAKPAPTPAVVTEPAAAPAESAATVQTAVVEDPAPAAPATPAPAPEDPAPDVVLTAQQTSAEATAGEEVSGEPVAAGPPPPGDTATATANPVLVSSESTVETAALTGTSPNGQITITIDQPLPGTVVAPGTPVVVTGTVSVGGPSAINVIYVIDVSGSTGADGGPCGDPNGDGVGDTILDCEIAGIIALNNSLGSSNVDVSIVTFDSTGGAEDLSPAAGVQTTTNPATDADGNGVADVVDVLSTLSPGGGTDFDAALAAVQGLLVPGEQNFVFFLSDGQSSLGTGAGSSLQAVADAGATVLTFAVGTGTSGCATGEPLNIIAVTTGGACTEVTDPSQLSTALTGLNLAGIDRVEIEVNGFIGQATVSPLGFFTITIPADILVAGPNAIIARAFGAGDLAGQVAAADTLVVVGNPVAVAGDDADLFLDLDFDEDDEPSLAGSLPVTGTGAGHLAATGGLSFLFGGLLLGSGRHLRRRRRRVHLAG